MSDSFTLFFAQATNLAATTNGAPQNDPNAAGGGGLTLWMFPIMLGLLYFALIRPQSQAKKKQEALIKSSKTGDRVVTTGGIHGVITNVKDATVIVKIAENVKIEVEKNHIEKLIRTEAAEAEKVAVTKS